MKKKTLKTIGLSVLGAAVLIGGASLIANNYDKDLKTIHPTFIKGGIDENGEYIESENSFYTKDLIQYNSFISFDFDFDLENNFNINVLLYDDNGKYMDENMYVSIGQIETVDHFEVCTANFCRLVVEFDLDKFEDDEVTYFDLLNVTSKTKIEVNKVSKFTLHENNLLFYYDYDYGMTWAQFINSKYNIDDKFFIDTGDMVAYTGSDGDPVAVLMDGENLLKNDKIEILFDKNFVTQ